MDLRSKQAQQRRRRRGRRSEFLQLEAGGGAPAGGQRAGGGRRGDAGRNLGRQIWEGGGGEEGEKVYGKKTARV